MMNHIVTRSTESEEFKRKSEKMAELVQRNGTFLNPYYSSDLPIFNSLDFPTQANALKSMDLYLSVFQDTLGSDGSLESNSTMTWYALGYMGYKFNKDLFNYVTDEDVIEIYNAQNIQVFRNLRAMDLLSYSIEELFCIPWTDLFIREDVKHQEATAKVAIEMFTTQTKAHVSCTHLGHHRVKERYSAFKYEYDFMLKSVHPLYDKPGATVALLAVEDISIVGPSLSPDDQERLLSDHMAGKGPLGLA